MSIFHKLASAVLASAMVIFAAIPSSRADIIYDVNVQFPPVNAFPPFDFVSISGDIETDGTLGPLASSDIIRYDLFFRGGIASDFFGGPVPFPPPPAVMPFPLPQFVIVTGSAFTATDSGLFFDFSGDGRLGFQKLDDFLRHDSSFCLGLIGCGAFPGTNITWDIESGAFHGSAIAVGNVEIGVARVPGPIAGAGLPGLILAGGGFVGWWRRRQRIA
jgi:hypothetical protein